ncbi:putative kirola-like [Capsicum annuum]|nr:putative kirola-like [Capsicum annuum]KAF3661210.1 putative kirola-like [Capsicum annuum]
MSQVQMDSSSLAFCNGPMRPTSLSQVRSLNPRLTILHAGARRWKNEENGWVHYWFEIPALIENYLCLSFVEKSLYHGEIGADESGVLTAMEIFEKKEVRQLLDETMPELPKPELPHLLEIPTLPKIEFPEVPKPELPSLPKPEFPEIPKPELPTLPKPELPKIPKLEFPTFPKPELSTFPKLEIPGIPMPEMLTLANPEIPQVAKKS